MLSFLKPLATGVMVAIVFLSSLNMGWGIPPVFNEEFFVVCLVSADEEARFKALSLPGIKSRIIAAKAYVRLGAASVRVQNFMGYCLGSSLDPRAQSAFAWALGEIGLPTNRVLGALLYDGLKDRHQDPRVRRASWEALQKLLTPRKFHEFVFKHLVIKKPLNPWVPNQWD